MRKRINFEIKRFSSKKQGRPLMLKEELEIQVQAFLKELHSNASVVNTAITMAAAEGIVQNRDSNLLVKTGGNIVIGQNLSWLV